MNLQKYITGLVFLLAANHVMAQEKVQSLSLNQINEIVKTYHPVAKLADIHIEKSKADIRIARGLFDPALNYNIAQKTFDGNDYYAYSRPEITIPTWFGIELSSGLEYLSGNRTNPVETIGETNFVGITIPLAKNLLMDKRRAALQTAKIFNEASEIEKRSVINNLLLDAAKSYWAWAQQYQVFKILSEAVLVNEKRTAMVTTAYKLGDRPAIDTTEAMAQLQYFELLKSQAWLDFQNAGLDLSLYLWANDNKPVDMQAEVVPADNLLAVNIEDLLISDLNFLLDAAKKNHPDLLIYNYKLNVLEVEKKLKFQELLPTVNFQYNQLGYGYNMLKNTGPLFENNFQYGLSLGIPLRLSQGRGEFRKAKLKITEVQTQQGYKILQIENKLKMYYNELLTLKTQLSLQEKNYFNYAALQRGEEIRFQSGESSLFLINARENKTLEALQKFQELKVKYIHTTYTLQWAAGLLML